MFEYFLSYIIIFILNIIIFLLLTLIIATVTLIERKIMSLVQRRVGPNYIGYKGRLQFIADALKLLLKHIYIINRVNRFSFLLLPVLVLVFSYLFWVNLVWFPSLAICEIEYNLLIMSTLSLIFSILLFLISWVSQNKYSILSASRIFIITIILEILLSFLMLYFLVLTGTFSFIQIVSFQYNFHWFLFIFLPILPLIIISFTLECGRIPFDLGEAESELIAGYTTEMGGFFFALFYLGEYFHLYCFSVTLILLIFGGWN